MREVKRDEKMERRGGMVRDREMEREGEGESAQVSATWERGGEV